MEVGIYIVEGAEQIDERILAFAGMAMFFRYGEDENGFNWYDDKIFNEPSVKAFVEERVDTAIENRQFHLRYQPIFPCSDGDEVVFAEALVRWFYPPFGEMAPSIFIPIIEKMCMTEKIDLFILSAVRAFQEGRVRNSARTIPIAVNLSRDSMLFDTGFAEKVVGLFEGSLLDRSLIQFEITEGFSSYRCSSEVYYEIVRGQTQRLHDEGFSILIDDYGEGMSNIRTICDMSFDILKIDKSLIARLDESFIRHLVRCLVSFVSDEGKKVVAEGVETEEQVAFLQTTSCNFVQGFLRCRPLDSERFAEMLDQGTSFFENMPGIL